MTEFPRSHRDNIAEGFGRFRPAEFANKTRIALGELKEKESSLLDGVDRGYFLVADVDRIRKLIDRASRVTTRLHAYLETCAQRGLYSRRRNRTGDKRRTMNGTTPNAVQKNNER